MAKDSTKAARACNACYETVFPLLDPPATDSNPSTFSSTDMTSSQTTSTIASFPSWMTLTGPSVVANTTEALMAIDRCDPGLPQIESDDDGDASSDREEDVRHGRLKMKKASSRRSYHEILEDFRAEEDMGIDRGRVFSSSPERVEEENIDLSSSPTSTPRRNGAMSSSALDLPEKGREETRRRVKRFSLPAVALQTTSVIAQSGVGGKKDGKRFSLGLGKGSAVKKGESANAGAELGSSNDLAKGVAAAKLNELLGKRGADEL
jgi:FYVE/RhoGEF/PH domain-containing protein 5/6